MAPRKRKDDGAPSGPGEWIVTFSDCMTLLLCFFVLLLTFSSFDDIELQKLAGIFNSQSDNSVFPIPREIKDSVVPPVERLVHMTEEGSETPSASDNRTVEDPPSLSPVLDDDAHKDRKTFYIPSQWLFWGKGTLLTDRGRTYLRTIGAFMQMIPSRVVIAEAADGGQAGDALCLDRAMEVMRFFTQQVGLPADRFSITARPLSAPSRLRGHRVVAVTLISRSMN